jgi:cytochrome c-type biogenesis protein CcmH
MAAVAAVAATVAGGWWWQSRGIAPSPPTATPANAVVAPLSASQVERSIERARDVLARDAKDATAWAMLAHSQQMLGRYAEARQAFDRLIELRPDDAGVLADAAESAAAGQGGRLEGAPATLAQRALRADPSNLKALGLAAKAAFERRAYAEARGHWQRALTSTQDPAVRRQIELSIAEAQALETPAQPGSGSSGMAFVTGRVSVSAELRSRLRPDDTLFVFARPADGSRMPVALLRRRAGELPLDFVLDDSLSMVPQARLSQQQRVIVGARISHRGDAIAAAGDLEGQVGPVALGSTGVVLEIDREVR